MMERCEEVKQVLLDYLLGELTEDEAGGVRAHLEKCRTCREEYRNLKEVVKLTASATRLKASREVYENLKEALLAKRPKPGLLKRAIGVKVSFFRAAIVVLIAAAVILVPAIYLKSRKAAQPPLTTEEPVVSEPIPPELAQIPADAEAALEAYVAEALAALTPAILAEFETPLDGESLEALVKERIAALVAANTLEFWRPIEVIPVGRPIVPPPQKKEKEEKDDGNGSSSNQNHSHLDPEHRAGLRGFG